MHLVFDLLGRFNIQRAVADDRGNRHGGEAESQRRTGVPPTALGGAADGEPPGDGGRPQTIGKVEDNGQDAHEVERGEQQPDPTLLEMDGQRAGRMRGVKLGHEAPVLPAEAQRSDVQENERHREIAGHPLQGVSQGTIPSVSMNIGLAGLGEDDAKACVKSDGAEEDQPLNDFKRGKRVNKIDFVLEGFDPGVAKSHLLHVTACSLDSLFDGYVRFAKKVSPDNRRVCGQVGQKEQSDREDPREAVQAAKQVVVAINDGHRCSLRGLMRAGSCRTAMGVTE